MQEKKVTNDELARMIAKGFAGTATKQDLEQMATKQDLERMATKQDLKEVKESLKIVQNKLDKALYREFQRIDRLEDWAVRVSEKTGIKLER